jgi:hypothetical protein
MQGVKQLMQVTIKYSDGTSLTPEEVVKLAQHNYGKNISVRVDADSPAPHDIIIFGLQQIITARQLELLYDNKYSYQKDIKALRSETLVKLEELLDTVIIDNESKVT